MRQLFHFLPIPENYNEVLLPDNALPIEYVDSAWQLLVCCRVNPPEYAFTTGKSLHRNWESTYLYHFRDSTTPIGAVKVLCPNGKNLAVKILNYEDAAELGGSSSKPAKKTNARKTTHK